MNRLLRPPTFLAAALMLAGVFSSNQSAFAQTTIDKGQLLITEFRFRGPDTDGSGSATGISDEFIEIYNNTDTDLNIGGVALYNAPQNSDPTLRW